MSDPLIGQKTAKPGTFQPGNPGGGRRKMDPEILEAFRKLTPTAVRVLGEILNNPESKDTDRLKAIDTIMDRVYGKPVQAVEAAVNTTLKPLDTSKLNTAQKDALAALAVANMGTDDE